MIDLDDDRLELVLASIGEHLSIDATQQSGTSDVAVPSELTGICLLYTSPSPRDS